MKKYILVLLSLSVLLGAFSSDGVIKLILTSNVNGETDPCGWKKKPMGGLARKSTIINNLKNKGNAIIVADAGNLFFKKDRISEGVTLETAKETAKIINECFNVIGCDAFSPGSHDFAAGFDFLKGLEKKSNFPFISANIFGKYDEQIFEPYIIIEKEGKKIGFIGLSSIFLNENLNVKDPFKILKSLSEEVAAKTDMVILLFNASEKDLNRLKTKNYPIDMTIRSRSNLPPAVSKDGGSSDISMYSIGMRGKYIFEFDIYIGDNSNNFIDLMHTQSKLDKANNFLNNYDINFNESIDLNIEFKDDPKTLDDIKKNLEKKERLEDILDNPINYFSFIKHSLDKQISDDPKILNIIDIGKEKINKLKGPPLPDDKGRLPGHPHHGHSH